MISLDSGGCWPHNGYMESTQTYNNNERAVIRLAGSCGLSLLRYQGRWYVGKAAARAYRVSFLAAGCFFQAPR